MRTALPDGKKPSGAPISCVISLGKALHTLQVKVSQLDERIDVHETDGWADGQVIEWDPGTQSLEHPWLLRLFKSKPSSWPPDSSVLLELMEGLEGGRGLERKPWAFIASSA